VLVAFSQHGAVPCLQETGDRHRRCTSFGGPRFEQSGIAQPVFQRLGRGSDSNNSKVFSIFFYLFLVLLIVLCRDLVSLSKFRANFNKLASFPVSLLSLAENLTIVALGSNMISSVPAEFCSAAKNLKVLALFFSVELAVDGLS
jgi:hypothetical protein